VNDDFLGGFKPDDILDMQGALRDRDEAIERVGEHAAPLFKVVARDALERVARRRPEFIVDAIWAELGQLAPNTHDKRAMGNVVIQAARDGVIENGALLQRSAQRQCHGNMRTVWHSKVYKGAAFFLVKNLETSHMISDVVTTTHPNQKEAE
jgi:hypothetical protein